MHGYKERKSGQYALYYALLNILKMYSVYVPHITEYIYSEFFKNHEKTESIHISKWQKPRTLQEDVLHFGEHIIKMIYNVRKQKSENNLSMRAEIEELKIVCEPEFVNWYKQTEKDLKACTNAKKIILMLK